MAVLILKCRIGSLCEIWHSYFGE